MKYLYVVADDFGLTPGVSEAICEAIECGVVTATSAMVCVPEAAATLQRFAPRIVGKIGLHFQLTSGRPVLPSNEVPSLVDAEGNFKKRRLGFLPGLHHDEVERELEAQLGYLRGLGIEPSHVDSHHHIHQLPGVFERYTRFAKWHGLRARGGGEKQNAAMREAGVVCPDVFCKEFFGADLSVEKLLEIVRCAGPEVPQGGTLELMTHPGRGSEELRKLSYYVEEREQELRILCSPGLEDRLFDIGFSLVRETRAQVPEDGRLKRSSISAP